MVHVAVAAPGFHRRYRMSLAVGNNTGMGKTLALLATVALLLGVGACDSAPDPLVILEPAPDAAVSPPFTVKVKVADTANYHVHLWFDGNESKFQEVSGDTAQVTDLPAGAHKMTVSLRNADHSDAGHRVEMPITVGAAGAPG
jgi:hypothetical protein